MAIHDLKIGRHHAAVEIHAANFPFIVAVVRLVGVEQRTMSYLQAIRATRDWPQRR